MYRVTYFNAVGDKLQTVYFSRWDDVINFLISRINIFDITGHFVKIGFVEDMSK